SLSPSLRPCVSVPGSPAGIKAAAASANAAMVSWLPPLTPNGLIRKYTIYLNYQGQPHTVVSEFESAPDTLLYRVGNLRTGTRYVVSVSASTAAGRGNATHSVPVEAMHKAPARVLSFGGRVSSPWMRDVQLPCRSVGEPGPSVRWTKDRSRDGVPVALWSDARRLIHTNGSLVIRAVKADDSGFYSCEASNSWGSDRITLQLTVQVPPDQPRLSVSKTTANSITLTWVTGDDGGSNIRGYVLQLSSERGERWDEVRVGPGERSLRVQQLRCGTWYKFTLAARNAVGTGRISEILEAKTQGKAPWFSRAEPDSHTLSFVNSTHAALLLLGLSDGGCPLTSFSIEFRPIGTQGWWRADGWSRVHAVLASLREGTWYEVRARACNAAGCSERLHSFATLDANGGTVPPLTRLDADSPRVPDGDGVALTASLCCGLLLLSAILALACAVRKHRRQRRLKRLRDAKSLAEMLMSKSSRAGDPPKWQPQTPRVHVDVPRAQLLIDDKGSTERLDVDDNATVLLGDGDFASRPEPFPCGLGSAASASALEPSLSPSRDPSARRGGVVRPRCVSQWTLGTTLSRGHTPHGGGVGGGGVGVGGGAGHGGGGAAAGESDSHSVTPSQDTDKGRSSLVSESASSTYEELARAYEHARMEEQLRDATFQITECFVSDRSSSRASS
uniref:Uncharacterized protein n=1 Tax=Petromyzon marinus TaxID=7757 RepID=S4RFJ7_PETMA